jgi:hypothetical protein
MLSSCIRQAQDKQPEANISFTYEKFSIESPPPAIWSFLSTKAGQAFNKFYIAKFIVATASVAQRG